MDLKANTFAKNIKQLKIFIISEASITQKMVEKYSNLGLVKMKYKTSDWFSGKVTIVTKSKAENKAGTKTIFI